MAYAILINITGRLWLAAAVLSTRALAQTDCHPGAIALVPHLRVGDTLATVLSYTVSFKTAGYGEVAQHSSGTLAFVVTNAAPDSLSFDVWGRSDGEGEMPRAQVRYKPGGHVRCIDTVCQDYTDASGVLYNPVMWGDAPSTLCDGATWTVPLTIPWGVGPVGSQKVTVLRVDTAAHMAWVRRDGTGNGPFAHDADTLTLHKGGKAYRVRIVPGATRWSGYTIFRDGVVIADEVLVERHDVLISPTLGRIQASERQIMMFDAMPHM
jgi:hypothetical protein